MREEAVDVFKAIKWTEEITPMRGFPARAIYAVGEPAINPGPRAMMEAVIGDLTRQYGNGTNGSVAVAITAGDIARRAIELWNRCGDDSRPTANAARCG